LPAILCNICLLLEDWTEYFFKCWSTSGTGNGLGSCAEKTKESSRTLQTGAMLVAASNTIRRQTALRFHDRRGSKAEDYVWDLWL